MTETQYEAAITDGTPDAIRKTKPPTIKEVLKRYASCTRRLDKINKQKSSAEVEKQALEHRLLQYGKAMKLDKFAGGGVSVTLSDGFRGKYNPAQWPDIVKWLVNNGYDGAIQRRLTDSKLLEMSDAGVAFPPGLSMESYKKISVRRTAEAKGTTSGK